MLQQKHMISCNRKHLHLNSSAIKTPPTEMFTSTQMSCELYASLFISNTAYTHTNTAFWY